MSGDYFRGLAARCRTSARACFDLYAQEEFGRLAREFDARAADLEANSEPRWSVGSSFRQQLPGFAGDH